MDIDFNEEDQIFILSITGKRNGIPRKSLKYQKPLKVFLSYMDEDILSSTN